MRQTDRRPRGVEGGGSVWNVSVHEATPGTRWYQEIRAGQERARCQTVLRGERRPQVVSGSWVGRVQNVSERCRRGARGAGEDTLVSGTQGWARAGVSRLLNITWPRRCQWGGGLKCRLPDALISASIFAPDPVLHGRHASQLFYCRVYKKI